MTANDLGQVVRNARFTPVRIREGYDMGEVDDLLDRLATALDAGAPVASLVEDARFTTVRMREGYEMSEVDALLADVVARSDGAGRPAAHEAPAPAPEVIVEHRSWWSRTFGPKGP